MPSNLDEKNPLTAKLDSAYGLIQFELSSEFFSSNYFQIGQHVVLLHILISIIWPHFLYLIMQSLNVFLSILSLIQNFILLPNINALELGIKVEKSISRTSPSLTLNNIFLSSLLNCIVLNETESQSSTY